MLTCSGLHGRIVAGYKEAMHLADKSRAEYFRERRKTMKSFNVMLKREKVEALEAKLKAEGRTKAEWLDEKVDEELGK
jgi:hypothetical protein|nr:MAG TPA: hypothetical protein [Caudoviricetes sp.]